MIKFKYKSFSKLTEVGGKAKELIHRSPILPFSAGSLVVGSANLAINTQKKSQDTSYQNKQLDAMNKLTDALTKVDDSLKNVPITPVKKERKRSRLIGFIKGYSEHDNTNSRMAIFRRKDFSILSDTIQGASIGATIGSLGSFIVPDKDPKNPKSKTYSPNRRKLSIVGIGTIVGAALGALVGLIKKGDKLISRRNVDKRLMGTVVENLKKSSFKGGIDFTRDPKVADQLKTKVCIVITKYSGDLRVLINTVADKKLRDLTNRVTKNIPNSSVINTKTSNRFNEITVSTISDGSADAGLVTGICATFIRSGYPVYLVEVG